jgi:hypothetical protein
MAPAGRSAAAAAARQRRSAMWFLSPACSSFDQFENYERAAGVRQLVNNSLADGRGEATHGEESKVNAAFGVRCWCCLGW